MEYVVQLWEKHLEPLLAPLWDSLVLWRTIALVFLTIFVLAFFYRQKILHWLSRQKYAEHDSDIFNRGDKILPEQEVYDALDTLEAEHASDDKDFRQMIRFEGFYDLEANRYLDSKIHAAQKIYLMRLLT